MLPNLITPLNNLPVVNVESFIWSQNKSSNVFTSSTQIAVHCDALRVAVLAARRHLLDCAGHSSSGWAAQWRRRIWPILYNGDTSLDVKHPLFSFKPLRELNWYSTFDEDCGKLRIFRINDGTLLRLFMNELISRYFLCVCLMNIREVCTWKW